MNTKTTEEANISAQRTILGIQLGGGWCVQGFAQIIPIERMNERLGGM